MRKMVIDNDGDAIMLDPANIIQVSRLYIDVLCVRYEIMWVSGKVSGFSFDFEKYDMEPAMLEKKVENIRMDVIKYLNNGENPEKLFGEINMKKETKTSKTNGDGKAIKDK